MKKLVGFFKTSLIGGLFVLLPLVLFYLLLSELLELVVALATPIADLFPKGTFDQVNTPVLMGLALIVGVSFVFGLALRSAALRQSGRWIEDTLLGRLPLYKAGKSLARGLVDTQEETAFRSSVLFSEDGEREIVYVIEEHEEGHMTVLVPFAPASFTCMIKIVSSDRVEMLQVSVGDASRVISHWGVGAWKLLENK